MVYKHGVRLNLALNIYVSPQKSDLTKSLKRKDSTCFCQCTDLVGVFHYLVGIKRRTTKFLEEMAALRALIIVVATGTGTAFEGWRVHASRMLPCSPIPYNGYIVWMAVVCIGSVVEATK